LKPTTKCDRYARRLGKGRTDAQVFPREDCPQAFDGDPAAISERGQSTRPVPPDQFGQLNPQRVGLNRRSVVNLDDLVEDTRRKPLEPGTVVARSRDVAIERGHQLLDGGDPGHPLMSPTRWQNAFYVYYAPPSADLGLVLQLRSQFHESETQNTEPPCLEVLFS